MLSITFPIAPPKIKPRQINSPEGDFFVINPFRYFTPFDKYHGGSRLIVWGARKKLKTATPLADYLNFKALNIKARMNSAFNKLFRQLPSWPL